MKKISFEQIKMSKKEIWVECSVNDNYQVSSFGRISNVKTGRVLRSGRHPNGYNYVILCSNAKTKSYYVHRLVLLSFNQQKSNDLTVDHIDEDKQNNRLSNLQFMTQGDNYRRSNSGENHYRTKLTLNQVKEITKERKIGKKLKHIAIKYNVSISTVSNIVNKKRWKPV